MACRHPFGILVQFDLQGQIVGPFILGTQRRLQLACQLIDHEQGFIDEFSGVSVVNRKRRVSAEQVKIRRCPHCKPFTYSVSFLGVAFASPDGAGSSLPPGVFTSSLGGGGSDAVGGVTLWHPAQKRRDQQKNEHGSQNGLQLHL